VTIKEAIANEAQFFNRHPTYSSRSHTMGIPYLSLSLNRILVAHVQRCIPQLSKQITMTIQQKDRELHSYELEQFDLDKDKCGPVILNMINRLVTEYSNYLEGTFVRDLAAECQGGARINYIFHKIFKSIINKIDPFEYLTDQDI
jgi:hypothetical protein